jgi:hypothetical protein
MKSRILAAMTAITGLICGSAAHHADAEIVVIDNAKVYQLHTAPTGSCPGLDWHILEEPTGELHGTIAWNGMKSIARAEGDITGDRSFTMQATEMGGAGRTFTVVGRARHDGWLVADMTGPGIVCKGIVVEIWRDWHKQ